MKVFANYGHFYARIPNDLAARALSADAGVTRADYYDAALTQPIPEGTSVGGSTRHLILAGLSPSLAVLLALVVPMAVVESVSDTAGTAVLQTDPPARMRGRVLGVWGSIGTVWGLGGPPALGLLMELAGARGALVAGALSGVLGVRPTLFVMTGVAFVGVVVAWTSPLRADARAGAGSANVA